MFRSRTPSASEQAAFEAKQKAHSDWMPYFLLQHDDYVTLKERVCQAVLDGGEPLGVASIDVGIEALKLAEALTPELQRELLA